MTIQTRISLLLGVMVIGVGCSTPPHASSPNKQPQIQQLQAQEAIPTIGQGGTADDSTSASTSTGQLTLTANGEDFVRQGLVSRDGWAIAFDHAYLTVTDVVASQSAQDSHKQAAIAFIDAPITVDLTGTATTEHPNPVPVITQSAKVGHYDALSWSIVPEKGVSGTDHGLQLLGTATKADQTIRFDIHLDPAYRYDCGEFIGDTRKGFVTADQETSIEMTIHLDHLFGDGESPADDEINTKSLGFTPLAAIAESGQLSADMQTLKSTLSEADYATLASAIESLGHVGEGHCSATEL